MSKRLANTLGVVVLLLVFLTLAIAIGVNAASRTDVMQQPPVAGGDARQGALAIQGYGCGACHTIPDIPGANGTVGPPLTSLAKRSVLAGQLPNNPDNLILWIMHPQEVRPGSDMPEMGVTEPAARDIAAYLYSVK
jgi:cytochrome c1